MSEFKVGDRVRTSGWGDRTREEVPDGMTGTVTRVAEAYLPYPYEVKLDVESWMSGPLHCLPHEIEPLDG